MSLFGWFKRPRPAQTKSSRETDPDKVRVHDALQKGKCPDCGSKEFYEGPSGGICTNYECAGCGSRFNVGGAFGTMMIADRI